MPREFGRHVRIAEVIRRVAAPELDGVARTHALGMVTVTGVEVSRDLTRALILVSVYGHGDAPPNLAPLRAALPALRSLIARAMRIRKIPQLALALDESIGRGARIAELLAPPKTYG